MTKALWAHIKKHDLQDPSDKRFILCDATLESLFGVKVGPCSFIDSMHVHVPAWLTT